MPVHIPAYGGRSSAVGGTQTVSVPVAGRQRTRGRVRVAKVLSSTMLGGVLLLIVLAAGGMALGVLRLTVIDTGSMRPTLNPGDVAILTSEPAANLHRGQIVAFHPPGEPSLTVTHRAVSVEHTKHGVIFQTQGDANNARDQWYARIVGNTVWHEALKLPKIRISGGLEPAATRSLRLADRHRDPAPQHAAGLDLASQVRLEAVPQASSISVRNGAEGSTVPPAACTRSESHKSDVTTRIAPGSESSTSSRTIS